MSTTIRLMIDDYYCYYYEFKCKMKITFPKGNILEGEPRGTKTIFLQNGCITATGIPSVDLDTTTHGREGILYLSFYRLNRRTRAEVALYIFTSSDAVFSLLQ